MNHKIEPRRAICSSVNFDFYVGPIGAYHPPAFPAALPL